MLRKAVFLFLTFLSVTAFSQDGDSLNCSDYKTGTFYVINGSDTCFVRRTEKRQFERCTGSDEEYEFIIIWLKHNKYILRDIHYNPSTNPRVMRKDVVMTVMETAADYHIVHVKIQGQKKQYLKVYCTNS